MSRNYRWLLLLPFLFIACKDSKKNTLEGSVFSKPWYKRYTGTVAGQPVVVNLFYYKSEEVSEGLVAVGGYYYYPDKSEIIALSEDDINDNEIHFTEFVETERDEVRKGHPEWFLRITDSGATGRWKSADGRKTMEIVLSEKYEEGAYPFDILSVQDSVLYAEKKNDIVMLTDHNILIPSRLMKNEDAEFVVKAILHEMGGDTLGAKTMNEFISASNKIYFADFRKTIGELVKKGDTADLFHTNWDMTINSSCEYNGKGFVVLDFSMYNYSGGADGNYQSHYINVDITGRKVWHLNDIITVDTTRLYALFDAEARKCFGIKPTSTLKDYLIYDVVPPTDNFAISDRGLTFHYNPLEIATTPDGDVALFLSYAKLGDLLKPEFKTRMKLN